MAANVYLEDFFHGAKQALRRNVVFRKMSFSRIRGQDALAVLIWSLAFVTTAGERTFSHFSFRDARRSRPAFGEEFLSKPKPVLSVNLVKLGQQYNALWPVRIRACNDRNAALRIAGIVG